MKFLLGFLLLTITSYGQSNQSVLNDTSSLIRARGETKQGSPVIYGSDYFKSNSKHAVKNPDSSVIVVVSNAGKLSTYKKVTKQPELKPLNDTWVDTVMILKKGSEYYQKVLETGVVDMRDFGIVADAVHIYSTPGLNFGKVLNTNNTDATKNNAAFRKAIAFIHNMSVPLIRHTPKGLRGYRNNKLTLKIPTGSFLITDPELFSKIGSAIQGYVEQGVIIEGEGMNSTTLVFRNDGDTSKFLINNDNMWNSLVLKDFSIACVTGSEKIYRESSAGVAGFTRIQNVGMNNFKRAIEIDGTGNADRMLVDRCAVSSSVSGNIFFNQNNNSQAVKHTFSNNSITITDGIVFQNNASGDHLVIGNTLEQFGSTILFKINPKGNELGEQVKVAFSLFGNKIEIHNTSIWGDIKGGFINVYSENMTTITSTAPHQLILRNNMAGVRFNDIEIRNFPIAFINNVIPGASTKPYVSFVKSRLLGYSKTGSPASGPATEAQWIANNLKFYQSDFATPANSSIARYEFDGCFTNTNNHSRNVVSNQSIVLNAPTTTATGTVGGEKATASNHYWRKDQADSLNLLKVNFVSVSTYAAMLALGTPNVMTIIKVAKDENKSATRTEYHWWPDGNRQYITQVNDN